MRTQCVIFIQEKVTLICGDRDQDVIAVGLAERRHKGISKVILT